jgi:hypothetical protein
MTGEAVIIGSEICKNCAEVVARYTLTAYGVGMKEKQQVVINGCKVLKKGVKSPAGKYTPAYYSKGALVDGRVCITVYAKSILDNLPAELGQIQNNTDTMTDYFEKDRVRFFEGSAEFAAIEPLCISY